jgi:hypothetical protein
MRSTVTDIFNAAGLVPTGVSVHIVVDSSFGDRLAELPIEESIWVVDSFRNRPAILRVRKERAAGSHFTSITAFDPAGATAEEILLAQLDTIDLHHGELSADAPWNTAIVYGVKLTPTLREAFRLIGFEEFIPTTDGFVARRKELRT